MCLSKWFKKKPQLATTQPVAGKAAPIPSNLTIPYPEEPPDHTKTVANTNVGSAINQWLRNYKVPEIYWDWWETQIDVRIFDAWPDWVLAKYTNIVVDQPAFAVPGTIRQLYCRAPFLNPGTVAHEQAHISYSLLTQDEKWEFARILLKVKNTDPLLLLLWKQKAYAMYNDDESHSEIFRYLGPDKMPESLKIFYPKLIGG